MDDAYTVHPEERRRKKRRNRYRQGGPLRTQNLPQKNG